ncbi:hypothetical protein [Desulforhopalus sp. 52FAK]
MSRIPLCSDDVRSRALYLQNKVLPHNYMGDFSLMGFVVSQYEDALMLLAAKGCQLIEVEGGMDIVIDSPDQLPKIQNILTEKSITCVYTDIADTLYQA